MEKSYEEVLEVLIRHFTSPAYKKELAEAKDTFFEGVGVPNEESDQYEDRISQFLDWYIFNRKLKNEYVTPVEWSYQFFSDIKIDQSIIKQFLLFKHSIYEFQKVRKNDVYLIDVLTQENLVVRKSVYTEGFLEKGFFEVRLIPFEGSYFFTRGFCFHPEDARKFILKEVLQFNQRVNLSYKKEDLMFRLMKMRYKCEQYRHVSVHEIYKNDNFVGI